MSTTNAVPDRRFRWVEYCVHLLLATCASELVCFAVELLLDVLFPRQALLIEQFFVAPSYIAPIALGGTLGFVWGKRLRRLASRTLFFPPLLLLAFETFWVDRSYLLPGQWNPQHILDNYFRPMPACSSAECGGQYFLVAPLVSVIASSLLAESGRRAPRRPTASRT